MGDIVSSPPLPVNGKAGPIQCVDYIVARNDMAYWPHIAVLGNSRDTVRVDAMVREPDRAVASAAYWSNEHGLPYAIVADQATMPPDRATHFAILHQSCAAAVVMRNGAPACNDDYPSLWRVGTAPRGWTLAALFAPLAGRR